MPTYNFIDEDTGVEFEEIMSMSEREDFLSDHPHIRQLPPDRVNIVWNQTYSGIVNDAGWSSSNKRSCKQLW